MESNLISVSKIFTEKLLRIPDYQRGYAWTNKEVSEFWNDLTFLEPNKNHYVGVLTLEDVPSKNVESWVEDHWIIFSKSYKPHYIVDGQQRITTVIILIQSIIEEVSRREDGIQLNYTDLVDIRRKFIFEEKSRTSSRSYIFGYDKDNPSYEYLKKNIFQEDSVNSSTVENTIYTQNLSNAKAFFCEKLKDMEISSIEFVYKKLTQHFLFNSYSLDEEIDTYVAFETMNNRGKPLSHLELLKNRLIYLTTKIDENDHHKSSLRHSINECWKSMYHFLGRAMANRLDDDTFLYHHSTIYFKELLISKEKPAEDDDKVYKIYDIPMYVYEVEEYRHLDHMFIHTNNRSVLLDDIFSAKPINDESRNHEMTLDMINQYVKNLKKSVETWYNIHNPTQSNLNLEIIEWLSKINKIRHWTTTRLLLLEVLNGNYSKDEVVSFLKNIERILLVQTMLYRHYYSESSEFAPLALYLKRHKNLPNVTAKVKDAADHLIKVAQSPGAFRESFKNGDFYTWPGIRYFLYQYEYKLKSNTKNYRDKLSWDEFSKNEHDKDFKTIEHIYPQTPKHKYWRDLFKGLSTKQKKMLRNSPGNLVALSHAKNSSLSNKPFSEKKKDYRNGCYSEIALTEFEDWGKDEILNRSVELMHFLDTNWELGLCPAAALKDRSKRRDFYLSFLNLNF
ncbi:DUF262 domain-containing protein [Pantoea dispersa]|uniref:DUF262 domain-containing protein n=1 Tax=Pantoea dispersa TaxID=59814 RepID=UPI0021F7BCE7|nr:DUF262 domain-containing HNH endonuclease family protein [Pantoea dispersa]MCW0323482.1 hypothetical protein [Pantoea dispersa]MCW0328218.1 hypothetical protein [Pantoea dispersa]MCW0434583.1 hypothetical protein [Pantoea dispersa]